MKTKQRGPLPPAKCPVCCYKMDAATCITDKPSTPTLPRPGDVTVCMCCATVLFYTERMQLRKATSEELAELAADVDYKKLMDTVLAAVRKIRPQMEEKYGPIPHAE